MDRNLGNKVAWITREDYEKANTDNTACSNVPCTDEGPVTALNYLKQQTSDWTINASIPTFNQVRKAVGSPENVQKKYCWRKWDGYTIIICLVTK